MHWTRILENVARPVDGRVAPVFRANHVAVALMKIGREQPLGRYELCQNLSIGEGSVRTMLRRLTEEGYLEPEGRQGQRLTARGRAVFEEMVRDIPFGLYLDLDGLVIHNIAFANLVRGKASKVSTGMRQRDEALIHAGHSKAGVTTLVYTDGRLLMPPGDLDVIVNYQRESLLILESLKPEDNDAVVIGSSEDRNIAREVSMAAAMTLFEVN
ncbi:MAG: DUF4443 domain-containing protein [Candidatus Thorarchaeota archaeon]